VTVAGEIRLNKTGDTRVINNKPAWNLAVQTDALKAQIGNRGPLYRRRFHDNARQWKTCRLLEVRHVETVDQANAVSEVESAYETAMNGWHDATATTASRSAANGITRALLVNNSGLLTVQDAILNVARTSGTITSVRVTGVGIDITWIGSIGAGETLVIDDGLQTVTKAGVDQYAGFSLGASVNNWLPLPVGTTTLFVTVTGGNVTVTATYFNQWP
jgi:hypothetical protein